MVIYHYSKVVSRHSIGLDQYLHIDLLKRNANLATQHISKHTIASARNFHPNDVLVAVFDSSRNFLATQLQAVAVVSRGLLVQLLRAAYLVKAFLGAEAVECVSIVD